MNQLENFLKVNGLNNEDLESILEQCFLSSLFEELIEFMDKKNLYGSFKTRLQNCYNRKEELFILEDLIKEFSNVVLLDHQLKTILLYLKAYYNKSLTRTPLSVEEKLVILNRQDDECIFCASSIDIKTAHFDHVIAFKFVGDELESNFQALCSTCNLEKSTDPFYHLKAYMIKPKRGLIKTTSNL